MRKRLPSVVGVTWQTAFSNFDHVEILHSLTLFLATLWRNNSVKSQALVGQMAQLHWTDYRTDYRTSRSSRSSSIFCFFAFFFFLVLCFHPRRSWKVSHPKDYNATGVDVATAASNLLGRRKTAVGGKLNLQMSKVWRRGARLLSQAQRSHLSRCRSKVALFLFSHFPTTHTDPLPFPPAHPPSNHWNEFKSILEGGRQTERFRLLYLICLQSHSAGDIYVEVHSYFLSWRHEKERRQEPNVPSRADLAPLAPPPSSNPAPKSWVMCFFIWSCVASHVSLVWQPPRQLPVPSRNALLSKTSVCELRSVGWKWEKNICYCGGGETQQTKNIVHTWNK